MVASVDRQRSGSAGLAEDEQAPLHTGGELGEGGAAGGANADVDYATIDVSQLKKREAADEPGPGADTDYAEIRKERKGAETAERERERGRGRGAKRRRRRRRRRGGGR
ncbi:U1 small nuclear ribonucleoprotein 70 kDa-like [Anguilla rostrata]|uniref:U1 small nuclear ribonucleoprotein 70 kDa-like n=1 Tax=Anguilla rostrata TaxID=7938 RepID=UPI0030CB29EC